jgi:flagellar hook protein FlgE
MLRSLFSGVSGLTAHQQMMDVVGNNIANVNTTGFKTSSAVFQDLLSQILAGSSSASGSQGGTNPSQIGLGSRVAGITTNFKQGGLQTTGKSTDLAIQGDGFFIISNNGVQEFTRAGTFDVDGFGNLVNPNGAKVQGWMADPATHAINTNGGITDLAVQAGQLIAPVQSTSISFGSSDALSSAAAIGTAVPTSTTVYDSQGNASKIDMTFTKTATNTWTCGAVENSSGTTLGTVTINFDPATGSIASTVPATFSITPTQPSATNWPTPITIDFGNTASTTGLAEYGGASTISEPVQNGSPAGTMQSYKIAADGTITATFSNGKSQVLGQLAMATFNNPAGLEKRGDSAYVISANSGNAQVGTAGAGGRGSIAAGSLEMSNVDLSQEFTNLIIAQRGFQANSKVITTSDDLLQTLLNLKN